MHTMSWIKGHRFLYYYKQMVNMNRSIRCVTNVLSIGTIALERSNFLAHQGVDYLNLDLLN